jgi:hypothetical protein
MDIYYRWFLVVTKVVVASAWTGDDVSGLVFAGVEAVAMEVLAVEVFALASEGYLWLAAAQLASSQPLV